MNDDPRWRIALAAVQEITDADPPSDERMMELWQTYGSTLADIANDGRAEPSDRDTAQDILDELAAPRSHAHR